jgi:hypothetical protein
MTLFFYAMLSDSIAWRKPCFIITICITVVMRLETIVSLLIVKYSERDYIVTC